MISGINIVTNSFNNARSALDAFCSNTENLESVALMARKIAEVIQSGNKVISCGNGGSMCDAMHFAEELTGRFRDDRRSLPAIAISDPSHITCTGNDYGFEYIFSRYIQGVGNTGDMLIAISTSGNSPNIIKAVEAAREKGIFTFALLGKTGGKLKDLADDFIIAPGETSDRIQEIHIKSLHIAIEAAEKIIMEHSK